MERDFFLVGVPETLEDVTVCLFFIYLVYIYLYFWVGGGGALSSESWRN